MILLQIGGFAFGDSHFEELLKVVATHQIWLENTEFLLWCIFRYKHSPVDDSKPNLTKFEFDDILPNTFRF